MHINLEKDGMEWNELENTKNPTEKLIFLFTTTNTTTSTEDDDVDKEYRVFILSFFVVVVFWNKSNFKNQKKI